MKAIKLSLLTALTILCGYIQGAKAEIPNIAEDGLFTVIWWLVGIFFILGLIVFYIIGTIEESGRNIGGSH